MLPLGSLENYQLSPNNGFLPSEPPLDRLPKQYEAWEAVCSNLPGLIRDKKIYQTILQLPTISTDSLHTEPEWRRAYVILGFLLNGYLWGSGHKIDRLPACISVPMIAAAARLGVPPCPTLAGGNLWNYKLLENPGASILNPDSLEAQFTFTGADDESWFYVVLVAIEARGGPIISLALEAFGLVSTDRSLELAACLYEMAAQIHGLGEMLPRMYERNDPHFFYNRIRPFLSGSKGVAQLPNGLFYEDGAGGGEFHQYIGPSAAQSSLLQFIDLALGVTHAPTGTKAGIDSHLECKSALEEDQGEELLQGMRQYMPAGHRLFLEHVSDIANIRAYVIAHAQNEALQEAYNRCLEGVVAFRNKHLQIVSRYVVLPSRAAARREAGLLDVNGREKKGKAVEVEIRVVQEVRGSAGSAPVLFLKQVRDETGENILRQ